MTKQQAVAIFESTIEDSESPEIFTSVTAEDVILYMEALQYELATQPKPPKQVTVTEPGVYSKNGRHYMVKFNLEGTRLYAKRFNHGSFIYDAGAIFDLTPADRLTLEQAEELSIAVGACMICGRTLTAKQSVARGIGPDCRKKYDMD
jgi:hypothetical protein